MFPRQKRLNVLSIIEKIFKGSNSNYILKLVILLKLLSIALDSPMPEEAPRTLFAVGS